MQFVTVAIFRLSPWWLSPFLSIRGSLRLTALDVSRVEMEQSDSQQEPMRGLVGSAGFIGNIWII
jgi:hypothetical protein